MIVQIRKQLPAMDIDSPTDQPQCSLLALPAELRNCVWRLVLLHDLRAPKREMMYLNAEPPKKKSRFCANILRTCKQINGEGTPILYGENLFTAHTNLLATLPSFLLSAHPNRACLPPVTCSRVTPFIRRYYIFVRLDTDPRYSKTQVEESFNGVEELQIDVFQSMYGSCDFSVLKLYEGVRGIGKVIIDGSLGDRKYASWLERCMQLPYGTPVTPFSEEYVGGNHAWHAWTQGNR